MRHLILGSDGQIGTHLRKYLKSANEEFIEYDIIRNKEEDLRFYKNPLLEQNLHECDIVHFLAFDVGGSTYMYKYQNSYAFISNNIKIMNNTFDLLKKYKKPFIFASSQMANMLHSTYGILKAIGNQYTKSLGGLIVKFWNVYGYETNPQKSHVITDFIKMAKEKGEIKMKTDGDEERQFLYGDDCSECLFILSQKYAELDKEKNYHITNFKWTKIKNVAEIISGYFNNCPIFKTDAKDTIQQNIKNEPDNYILNYWQPKTLLNDGVGKIIEYMNSII